jgi:hypothetical protein
VTSRDPRHPARVPSVFGGSSRLAPVPPCPSVLPPGAGNEEPEKAIKTGKERAKKTEERYVVETGVVQRDLDASTIARHDDGDMAAIPAIEQTQRGLPNVTRPTRAVRAVYEAPGDRATTCTTPSRSADPADGAMSEGLEPETTRPPGMPAVSTPIGRILMGPITSSADLLR